METPALRYVVRAIVRLGGVNLRLHERPEGVSALSLSVCVSLFLPVMCPFVQYCLLCLVDIFCWLIDFCCCCFFAPMEYFYTAFCCLAFFIWGWWGLTSDFVRQTWRRAYEKQVQETEALKREGGETALAAQWRQRYEKLSLEKVRSVDCCLPIDRYVSVLVLCMFF